MNPVSPNNEYFPIPSIEFIRFQLKLLENLFDLNFLKATNQTHPAQKHWSICVNIVEKGGLIKWNESDEYFRSLLQMVIESDTFITIGNGGIGELQIGDLKIYGDPAVQRKIKSRLQVPLHYNPLMLELSVAAYNLKQGHEVTPLEEENKPDLRVRITGLNHPVYIECKCLESITENRINASLRDSNRQIKSIDEDCYGLVILDLSNAMSRIVFTSNTDDIPEEIQRVRNYVQRALSGNKNRSISKVILRYTKAIKLESSSQRCLFLEKIPIEVNHEAVSGVNHFPNDIKLYRGETLFARVILHN